MSIRYQHDVNPQFSADFEIVIGITNKNCLVCGYTGNSHELSTALQFARCIVVVDAKNMVEIVGDFKEPNPFIKLPLGSSRKNRLFALTAQ